MTVELPDEEVSLELSDAMVRALIAFADTEEPGARIDALRVGEGEIDVRVYDGTPHHERVSIEE